MLLKWQSKPKYDVELADERSLAGQLLAGERTWTLERALSVCQPLSINHSISSVSNATFEASKPNFPGALVH
ncbi:hypothetical protein PUN4_180097 [Paraburkholderia unamae]|nr:hypothetical protein PUN4_180097 [Paraburkholderia unamae]